MRSLLLILVFLPGVMFAQIWDDFSDGDFTQNPSWNGDSYNFVVNDDEQLQLAAEGEAVSQLTTTFNLLQETEWRFWIRLSFSPSANNYARYYLASDQPNLTTPQNGYFLQFGESGSNDAIELFRQNGEEIVSICRGTEGLIASSFQFWVRVRKDGLGNWTIETDQSGSGAYMPEASGTDNTINNSSFLGVYCKYTSSNSNRFYFDDVYAGAFFEDHDPPELVQLSVTSPTSLDLLFNEALNPSTAQNNQNFFVSNQIGNPIVALLDNENAALIHLLFDRDFPNGESLTINISNISDVAGNIAEPIQQPFSLFIPHAFDIQINEIMADPNPTVGLPDWEYLELYNRTSLPVDLTGWNLTIGTSEKEFGNISIEAGEYLILGHEDAAADFIFIGKFYGFSSFALTNSGQTIILQNPDGAVISAVTYTDEWYRDANKDEGGWSLEQIDSENPCGGIGNWAVSVSPQGGTPGAQNSVIANNPDMTPPFAQRVEIVDSITLILHFSEPMHSLALFSTSVYEIDQGVGTPVVARPSWPIYQTVELTFSNPFENSVIYTLQISGDLSDCAGNPVDKSVGVSFGLPEEVASDEIVINEVLFNPKDDYVTGVDFVEIYNRSNKILDLSELVLATENAETLELESPKPVSADGYLFFPGQYLVLTANPDVVKIQYLTNNPDGFIKMSAMPSYNNDEGIVIIATKGFQIIDRMEYSEEMQYPLLTSFDGVSLERIHYDRPSNDKTNWHSAAENVGFATPGDQNSQFSEAIETDEAITIDPEVFSPDSDGKEDVLNINYQFSEGGNNCNINIFDSRGRPVRTLVNNEMIGTSGQFSWDGLNDDHEKAAIGIYVIFVEIFNTTGNRTVYKKTAVLATRF